jgi:AraC-like DNA-binding protein
MRCFPHTGFLFVDGPVLPYNDQSVDLEAILPRAARLPFERIANAPDISEAVRVLEHWCMKRLAARPVTTADRRFAYACVRILRGLGMPSISSISRDSGIGTRQLERLFRSRAGIPPKLFARIIRFQHALGHLDRGSGLAALAQRTGHFDQAHFIREFRRFAGVTPREFGREQHPWTRHFAEPGNRSYLYNSV